MCQINLIFNRKLDAKAEINQLIDLMTFNAWQSNNDDGEGYLRIKDDNLFYTATSKNKIRFSDFKTKTYFIATHNRLATSGFNDENIQPIETANLILLHNGVLYEQTTETKSDSRIFAERLEENYIKHNKKLIKAIKETTKETSGSLSILVADKNTKQILYFKDDRTSLSFVKSDEWLILATSSDNIELARYFLNIKQEAKEPKEFKIYDVLDGFKIVGDFKKKEIQITYITDSKRTGYKDYLWGYNGDSYADAWNGDAGADGTANRRTITAQTHLNIHKPNRVYCAVCGRRQKLNLKFHIDDDANNKRLLCEECFIKKAEMNADIQKNKSVCSNCDATLSDLKKDAFLDYRKLKIYCASCYAMKCLKQNAQLDATANSDTDANKKQYGRVYSETEYTERDADRITREYEQIANTEAEAELELEAIADARAEQEYQSSYRNEYLNGFYNSENTHGEQSRAGALESDE